MSEDAVKYTASLLGVSISSEAELNAYMKQRELQQIVELDRMKLPFPIYGYLKELKINRGYTEITFKRDKPKERVTVRFYNVVHYSLREDKKTSFYTVFSLTPPEPPRRDYFSLDDSKCDQISLDCKSVELISIQPL